jgi:hypothetical protein
MNVSIADLFENWARIVTRRPWLVLVLAFAIVAGFASRIPLIVVDTSTEGFLHRDDPIMVAYDDFRAKFGRDDSIVIGIETSDPFTFVFLERLRDFHEDLERSTPFVAEITSMLNARWTHGVGDQLLVEDLVEPWPTDPSDLDTLRARVADNPLYRNNLISEDGRIVTVFIELETFVQTGIDSDGRPLERYLSGDENREVIDAARSVIDRHQASNFAIHTVGLTWMADRLAFRLLEDLPKLVRRALIAMAVILFALFGSIRGVVLPLVVVMTALVVTFAALPLLGMTYQLPTQVVALSLMAIGIGDSVHVLAMYYHRRRAGRAHDDALAEAFAHAGPAILITSLTTAAALLSFLSAELAPISNLGLLLPIGVGAAFVATVTLLPALLTVLPEPKRQPTQRSFELIERGIRAIGLWAADHPRTTLGAAAIALTISVFGVVQVRFVHDALRWFPEGDSIRDSTLLLDDRLGGIVSLEILFETDAQDAVKNPELLNALDDLTTLNNVYSEQSRGDAALRIAKTISIVDLLKETNRALNENRQASYRLPESKDLVAQELLLFELSGNDDLSDLADYQYQTARMTLRVPWLDATAYGEFAEGLTEIYRERIDDLADVHMTGRIALLSRTMTAVIQSMTSSYALAFAAVAPLMMIFLGSVRLGLVSMIPNLLPVVAAVGLLGWLDIPLDVFTLLTGSITLGVAVDDTIHFMHGVRKEIEAHGDVRAAIEQTLRVTGQALFSTTLILCCGFGLYATAYMQNFANFGIVTSFALATALLADIAVAPALVTIMGERSNTASRTA